MSVSLVEASISPDAAKSYDDVRRNRDEFAIGRRGAGTLQLQKDLNEWLVKQGKKPEVPVTGELDGKTEAALKSFQSWARDNVPGLKEATGVYKFEVDGIFGPRTARQMDLALGRPTLSESEYRNALESAPRVSLRLPRMSQEMLSQDCDAVLREMCASLNVPIELVRSVMAQESAGDQAARSPKGAIGLMQLMPPTAAMLGVDPYDPRDNIRGGVTYLRQMLDRYDGNVELALAAYNAGPGAVDKFGKRVPDYRETRDYVAKVMGSYLDRLESSRNRDTTRTAD